MGKEVRNDSRVCPLPPGPLKDLNRHLRPRGILMAVGLSFILTTSLMYYLMLPPALPLSSPPPPLPPATRQITPHGVIAIDGDANFSATALLEGWPGDGSPGNPFIIDGLEIELNWSLAEFGHCIYINNTRVSFIISNCNLRGAEPFVLFQWAGGITLDNVTSGLLVNNFLQNNSAGIYLVNSHHNNVINNTCYGNGEGIILELATSNTMTNNTCDNNYNGIMLQTNSTYNTVVNNTCTDNMQGIILIASKSNTVTNNTCSSIGREGFPGKMREGISLYQGSDSNNVTYNTCNNNDQGIVLHDADSNTLVNNTCNNNTVTGIEFEWESHYNIVVNNTCNNNDIGIEIYYSSYNTIVLNTCNYNRIGIYLGPGCGYSNIILDNTCLENTENDIADEEQFSEPYVPEVNVEILFLGFMTFIAISLWAGLMVGNRVSKGD